MNDTNACAELPLPRGIAVHLLVVSVFAPTQASCMLLLILWYIISGASLHIKQLIVVIRILDISFCTKVARAMDTTH